MKLEELVLLQVDRLQRALREFVDSKRWQGRVMRLKEIRSYERELSATIERLENVAENDFREQTGERAVRPWWKIWRLPPPKKSEKVKKNDKKTL